MQTHDGDATPLNNRKHTSIRSCFCGKCHEYLSHTAADYQKYQREKYHILHNVLHTDPHTHTHLCS